MRKIEECNCPKCGNDLTCDYYNYPKDIEENGASIYIYYYVRCRKCRHDFMYTEIYRLTEAYSEEN